MFDTTIAGSLPKPAWLAETQKLWPQWRSEGDALQQAKLDATLLWIKAQEDAGLDTIGDGEMSRQHFVHGFLEFVEGIDRTPGIDLRAIEQHAVAHGRRVTPFFHADRVEFFAQVFLPGDGVGQIGVAVPDGGDVVHHVQVAAAVDGTQVLAPAPFDPGRTPVVLLLHAGQGSLAAPDQIHGVLAAGDRQHQHRQHRDHDPGEYRGQPR